MAYTQTDLDNLDALIAAGEGEVLINGKKVVYRSLAELMKIREFISRDLATTNGPTKAVRLNVTKGL